MEAHTEDSMNTIAMQSGYYDRRWSTFQHANLYDLERCVFVLKSLQDLELNEPKICDLGCGAGWLTAILNSFGPAIGVELSPQSVEQAKRRYPEASFVCADATQWEPPAGGFDVLVSQEVIEHIVDKPAYLAVAYRALRMGGYLFMTTPNLDVLNAIPEGERVARWQIQPVELPLNRQQLNTLLEASGFQVLEAASVVTGCGKCGWQRLLNSSKLGSVLSVVGLKKAWRRHLARAGYGMYLTTIARKVSLPRPSQTVA
jgi:2-polyprenyl-3-methyl-5-hydroxy-6-metoxy-1,4-benzoquinol methylase